MSGSEAVQAAATLLWLGMVLAISFLEAPIKFRAPGVTIPIGVGIGRLVFRALNACEAGFLVALVISLFVQGSDAGTSSIVLVVLLAIVLALGAGVLRPMMDRRYLAGQSSSNGEMPRNQLHLGYIALECVKVALLIVLSVVSLRA